MEIVGCFFLISVNANLLVRNRLSPFSLWSSSILIPLLRPHLTCFNTKLYFYHNAENNYGTSDNSTAFRMFNLFPTPIFLRRAPNVISFLFILSPFFFFWKNISTSVSFVLLYNLFSNFPIFSFWINCLKTILVVSNVSSHCPVWHLGNKLHCLLITTPL